MKLILDNFAKITNGSYFVLCSVDKGLKRADVLGCKKQGPFFHT